MSNRALPARISRALMSLVIVSAGRAALASPEGSPFQVLTPEGSFEISQHELPPPRALPPYDRVCRVSLAWVAGRADPASRGCPEAAERSALEAVRRWSISAPAGISGRHDLGEIWFVYPEDPKKPPRALVRQSYDRALVLPDDIDALPFEIHSWSFVRWPEGVHREDHPDVRCAVEVETDPRGATTEVFAAGCEEPFRSAVVSAVRQWHFTPATFDGRPLPTALSLVATFTASAPMDPRSPSQESQRLWDERRYEELTREERLWFIERALLGFEEHDLGPGRVLVRLPGSPRLGARVAPDWSLDDFVPPPLPDHPPVALIGIPSYPAVQIYDLPLPKLDLEPASCPLLVQVDTARRISAWAEPSCAPALRSISIGVADTWLLAPASDVQVRARFHARLEILPGGKVELVLPAEELRVPPSALPEGVHTERVPRPIERVPPRLRKGVTLAAATCALSVRVDARGKPIAVELLPEPICPPDLGRAAVNAVEAWRWSPGERDGVAVPSTAEAQVRFQP